MTKEDLQAISDLMDQKLHPIQQNPSTLKREVSDIKQDIQSLTEKVDTLTEAHVITRDGVNRLLDW